MAKSASPAGSNSRTPRTDAVRAAGRSCGGEEQAGATGQSVNRKEKGKQVICYMLFLKCFKKCATETSFASTVLW